MPSGRRLRRGWSVVADMAAPRPGMILGIGRFYHDPRGSVRAVKDGHPEESTLLAYLMIGLAIILVGRLIQLAQLNPVGSEAFLPQAGAAVFGQIFVAPLFCYGLAALGTGFARLFRGAGGWREGRLAFFWAILVSSPVVVLSDIASRPAATVDPVLGTLIGQVGPVFFAWALAQCFAGAFGFTRTWAVFLTIAVLVLALLVLPIYMLTR